MDFGNITLNNGDIVLIRSKDDLIKVIEEYLSGDIATLLSEIFIEKGSGADILDKIYDLAERMQDLSIDIQNEIDNNEEK
jgi:hypothetical protein